MRDIDLEQLADLARLAGKAILEVYETEFSVEQKADHSPLTLADRRSHQIITEGLQAAYPDVPILSEEGKEVPYEVRKSWTAFWLVDPLDGTKEFIKRNGEFSVNIALIEDRQPTVGVLYLPVLDRLYLADVHRGCWELSGDSRRLLDLSGASPPLTLRVLKSRSHPSADLEAFLARLPAHESITRGSALKFGAIAAGEADFYPRFGPTWEWDTAAGQAVVTAAGGAVVDLTGKPFTYNKADLVNGPFLAVSSLTWLKESGLLARVSFPTG